MVNYNTDFELPSKDQMDNELSRVKTSLYLMDTGAVFLSSIMNNTEFIWDMEIPTACTNGIYIKFNPYFFLALSPDLRLTVLVHEIWHIAYMHIERMQGLHHMFANMAADYVINNDMKSQGFRFDSPVVEPLLDPQYNGMSFEQVYDLLIKQFPPLPSGSSGSEGECQNQIAKQVMDAAGGMDIDPDGLSPDEVQEIITKVLQAAQTSKMSGEHGVIPGEIEQIIENFLNPILPWEDLLQNFFNEMCNSDYSYRRPSRRHQDEIVMPTLLSDGNLEIINYYIDVSGSISDAMLLRFNSEIAYIKTAYEPEVINIIQFDTRITKEDIFEDMDSFNTITIYGRGGTELEPVREHIIKHKPNAAVIFSDLYCNPMISDPGVPIVWCVFNNPVATPEFGTTIHVPYE